MTVNDVVQRERAINSDPKKTLAFRISFRGDVSSGPTDGLLYVFHYSLMRCGHKKL